MFHAHPVSGVLVKQLKKTEDDAAFFRTLALHFIRHNREDPRIMKLAIYSSIEGGHFWELTRTDETGPLMITLISDYIQKRIDDGAFVKTNAKIAARLFVDAVFMHIADKSTAITGPPLTFPDEKVVETLIDIFLGGLKKK
ncbi:MAG: hypothetical protein PHU70_01140 [Dehalococcoidia bacterium]|nr:hypothetical protein [Dehalococcoidia bacterium]MDD5647405.1 hypothetical protein [Dehalococcoidia bacterium]